MPRYFYDLTMTNEISRDTTGTVCRDDETAMEQAWKALPGITNDFDRRAPWQRCELTVRREDGLHIGCLGLTVDFEGMNPATKAMLAIKDESKPLLE